MSKIKLTLIMMLLLAVSAFGGIVFAYGQKAPSLAVGISFVSLVMNYILSRRVDLAPF